MRQLIQAARTYYAERDRALAEVEQLLSLEDEEAGPTISAPGAAKGIDLDRRDHKTVTENG